MSGPGPVASELQGSRLIIMTEEVRNTSSSPSFKYSKYCVCVPAASQAEYIDPCSPRGRHIHLEHFRLYITALFLLWNTSCHIPRCRLSRVYATEILSVVSFSAQASMSSVCPTALAGPPPLRKTNTVRTSETYRTGV